MLLVWKKGMDMKKAEYLQKTQGNFVEEYLDI